MSILRRLCSAIRARLRHEENGFTLAELLVVISISGFIVLVLGAAFVASARTSMAASTRLNESRDAKLLDTYWVADGAGASFISKSTLPPSTPAPAPCAISDIVPGTGGNPGSPVALFAWTDASGVKKNAFYLAQGTTLIRRLCSAGVKVSDVKVNRNLSSASLVCEPVNCFGANGTSGMPSGVALTVTERSGYSYTVKVSPRGTDVLAGNDGPPSVRSIVHAPATPTPSNLSQIQYRVTFSESVTGVNAADFFLSSLPTGATIASVIGVGGGTTYTVVVNTNSMSTGTITLNLHDDDSIMDRTNKPLNGTGTANTAGEQFVIDKVRPTVTLVQATGQMDPAVASTIHFTATFSEPVVGFDASKITLGGTAAGAMATVNPGATNVYDVVVTGLTSEGTVTASIAAGAVTDQAGNLNSVSTGDNSVMYDTAVPSVVSVNRAGPTPTNAGSVSWTVTFSENVTGVNTTDFTLVPGNGLGGTPAVSTVTGSGRTWFVTATAGSGSGTLGLNLVDNDTIVDQAAKKLGGTGTTGATNGSFAPGQVYGIDRTAPTVNLVQKSGQADPANGLPILFTVTFNEAVSSFDATDVTLGGTAGLAGATVTVPAGCTTACDIGVAGVSTDGTVTASVHAGSITDVAGNANMAASNGSDSSVVYDAAVPSVVSLNRAGPTPTNTGSVSWTVIFSENVTGVDKPDFAVASTGLGGSPAVATVTGAGTTWTVTASTGTGTGTLGLNLTDNGSIVDQVNNKLGGTGTTGTFTGQLFTLDHTAPTVVGVVLANGGTLGTADTGDSVVITYSEPMDASSFYSGWVNDGTTQSFNAPVQIDEADALADTSSSFLLGSVGLNADYISNGFGSHQTTFNSTITYDPATKKLTITLGSVASDTGNRQHSVGVGVPAYSPNVALADLAGNTISNSAVSGTSSRF